jgi:putative membrane protein
MPKILQLITENTMKKTYKLLTMSAVLGLAIGVASANSPAELNDVEIAHVAYTADNIDIRYAHLALAISTNPEIHEFANTMIRDHTAVNTQALALLKKLGANPQDNFLSQNLEQGATALINEMSQLRGAAFDRRYAENELGYHKAVNDLVENAFIPNIENGEVKALFKAGLKIFKAHEGHAENMVKAVQ